jgi:hypothetical protein
MVWVPSTKVHARVLLSKHVRQKFFFTLIKLCKVENVTEIRTNTLHTVTPPHVALYSILYAVVLDPL